MGFQKKQANDVGQRSHDPWRLTSRSGDGDWVARGVIAKVRVVLVLPCLADDAIQACMLVVLVLPSLS